MKAKIFVNKLAKNENLIHEEAQILLTEIMSGRVSAVQIASILTALHMKGETVAEIVGFIRAIRENGIKIHAENAIDVCGTGGDGKGTFNISTAAAFVIAGAGVPVAKHGNRGVTSQCGSADVLEALGVKICLQPEHAEKILQKIGMAFLFAPFFHPSFAHIATVRKELGIPTIFNVLGPFTNPAGVKKQLIGVPTIEIAEKLIYVGRQLRYEHLMIVTSEDGLDEVSVISRTHIFEIKNQILTEKIIDPKDFGFSHTSEEKISGGNAKENAQTIKEILDGKKGIKRDVIVFNSAFGLLIGGKVNSISEGVQLAQEVIDSGKAKRVLDQLIQESQ